MQFTRPALGPMGRFLSGEEIISVTSSNVRAAQYLPESRTLVLWYKDGTSYPYDPVSRAEAASFYAAPSKGTWVWDHLRIRGTKHGHRKNVGGAIR